MSSQFQKLSRLVVLIVLLTLSVSVALGQDTGSRLLSPGVPITGTLDAQNIAQVYAFAGATAQKVSLTVTSASKLKIAILMTDAGGEPVAQASTSEAGADVTLSEVELKAGGTYYVTVLAAEAIPANERVDFELTLQGPAAPAAFTPPGELLTRTGLQVELTWNSNANMDLEVRDPVGGSLRFATPSVASGGQFGVNVNSVCNNLTANGPTESASWTAGVVPTGSYEVLVYYQPLEACPTTDPVSFTVNATVDGVALPPFEGTLNPNQVYITSFIVQSDGTLSAGLSGVKTDPPTVPDLAAIAPVALTRDTVFTGAITSQQPYRTFSFEGQAGDIVSVVMNANSGNLDTLLMLLDPNGNVVTTNDDREAGVTDSQISNTALVLGGAYTVVATRYGQSIGGTQGGFALTLTGQVSSTSGTQAVTLPELPNLPQGSVEVVLQWNTAADIQLLVRDPRGDTVFNDRPQISSGGTLAANGNVNCRVSSGTPLSYIYWPQGRLPSAGAYEVEVQFRNNCTDTRPADFTLYVIANNQLVASKTEQLRQDERYVTSFSIGVDGQVTGGEGGVFGTTKRPDVTPLDYTAQLENAQVIANGQSLAGSIRLNQRFDVYVFDGRAGQVVTLGMNAQNGTLDPVLFLLNPGGVQIAQNDDAASDTTNALINGFTLSEDGRYIIIATHFGGPFGVTAGDYNLTLRLS